MRRFPLACLATCSILVLTSCGNNPNADSSENASGNLADARGGGQPPAGAMTIDAQKIVSDPGSIRTLHGEFVIRAARPNEPSVNPATLGGACLIAKIPVEGKSCNAQEECNVAGKPEWFGYCLGPDRLPTTQGGTCWVKLSDEKNCLKKVGEGDHSTPSMDMTAAYDYVAEKSPNWRKPIDWALLGCLNGVSQGGPPCATGNGPHIYRTSQVRPVP